MQSTSWSECIWRWFGSHCECMAASWKSNLDSMSTFIRRNSPQQVGTSPDSTSNSWINLLHVATVVLTWKKSFRNGCCSTIARGFVRIWRLSVIKFVCFFSPASYTFLLILLLPICILSFSFVFYNPLWEVARLLKWFLGSFQMQNWSYFSLCSIFSGSKRPQKVSHFASWIHQSMQAKLDEECRRNVERVSECTTVWVSAQGGPFGGCCPDSCIGEA